MLIGPGKWYQHYTYSNNMYIEDTGSTCNFVTIKPTAPSSILNTSVARWDVKTHIYLAEIENEFFRMRLGLSRQGVRQRVTKKAGAVPC